jgi:hypothetical protein
MNDMGRRSVRGPKQVMVAALAIATLGCELLPDLEFAQIERSLELTIVEVQPLPSGNSSEFVLRFTNKGQSVATACLGPSRSVWYDTAGPSGVSSESVDHPGCAREFTVRPGQSMTWSETLEVPHLTERRVEVAVSVQVVNPRQCSGWGCASTEFKSNTREIATAP